MCESARAREALAKLVTFLDVPIENFHWLGESRPGTKPTIARITGDYAATYQETEEPRRQVQLLLKGETLVAVLIASHKFRHSIKWVVTPKLEFREFNG
jgi:hypothetical protein